MLRSFSVGARDRFIRWHVFIADHDLFQGAAQLPDYTPNLKRALDALSTFIEDGTFERRFWNCTLNEMTRVSTGTRQSRSAQCQGEREKTRPSANAGG